jgi:glycosyltransferase involved in cell wall biosynthesis
MTATLIISTYNWPEALELCLLSVLNQSKMPLEVIIADDGSKLETKLLIEKYEKKFTVPLNHVWHEDKGFRKCIILNKAISEAKSDYIIQIDGDVILHKDFIKDHLSFSKKGTYVRGNRCMIGKIKTKKLIDSKTILISYLSNNLKFREHGFRSVFLNRLKNSQEKPISDGVFGSNISFYKNDFIAINGYNNDFQGWGAEDKELAQRLVNYGVNQRKMKFLGIQFHLHHQLADRKNHDVQVNVIYNLLKTKQYFCQNGLNQV